MRVRVIGAGVVGLTSALRLAQAGHDVDVVAGKVGDSTTSALAAALWYPYRAYPEADVTRWSSLTYATLCGLAADPSTGVRLRLGRELFRSPAPDPWWRDAVPELGRPTDERLPAGYLDGYELTVPVVDMAVHLPWLLGRLTEAGVAVRGGQVDDLAGAFAGVDAVVNCTGLGARKLLGDGSLTPVRGQVVVVAQVGLSEWLLDQTDPGRLTYIVPRSDTVLLGGTADEGDEDLTVRPGTAAGILDRCAALVPALRGARVLRHRVGLRPGRPRVRLEAEVVERGPVVHCYGHGGAGVTLSYGCADEVAELVSGLS
ncbi:FAD-dependent oxidoreductase [Micromonospora sp. WMMD1082]|uniref:FAD-dependent oxidoreductase n=1 Tax=Micromonospora sp. WMMD1082 TaxID=3016104 RepID=UPI002416656F|nr:FAD-dependent oxidoreductase [Micromonospora sp. WMMD1082]MDG4798208.1 FAD-dependent oxidoreductase [Micromonospora sp. WMMD1082]